MSNPTRQKKSPFAEREGKLYVRLDAVMHPLCALADGLPLILFSGERAPYLAVDVAIKWCQDEMQFHSEEKYKTIIKVLEKFKRQEGVT